MNENPLERFSESRHRWLIVTAVTFITGLLSLLPQVDLLIAERSERAELLEELAQAVETADRLPVYEKRVAEKTAELKALQQQEVDEAHLAELRSWLVSAARESGCQVRRIDFAAPTARQWKVNDNPLEPPSEQEHDQEEATTPFDLQTRPVNFSVTGSSVEVLALLRSIDEDKRVKHTNTLDLKPSNSNPRELQLDLSLWYFALVKPKGVA